MARKRDKSLPVKDQKVVQQIRIDKWIWATRFFKSRSAASKACSNGKILINGHKVKASKSIGVQAEISIKLKSRLIKVRVLKLIGKRIASAKAIDCFELISESIFQSEISLASAFYTMPARERGRGRPTKKERRALDKNRDID